MKTRIAIAALCALLFSVQATIRADEKKAPIKSGGNFDVEVIKDVAYFDGKDADPQRHKLDLYVPKGHKGFPVLVFIHGGGWFKGDRGSFEKQGRLFARNGIGAVSVGYRLTPVVTHPGHIQDVAKAFAWVVHNIATYGGRTEQIFVSGHSAGGHLASLLATNDKYLKAEKVAPESIKGVIAISGVYTIEPGKMKAFGSDEESCKDASPVLHAKAGAPPFLILYADKDGKGFDKMAEAFCKALKDAKDDAACLRIDNRDHRSIMLNVENQDDPATQAILEFIARHAGLKLTSR